MTAPFRHEALPFPGTAAFVSCCADAVREGLAEDARLIVLAQQAKLDEVRDELGGDAEDVAFVSTDEHGRNPGRIATMLHSFQEAGDDRRCVGVTEMVLMQQRSPAARAEAELSDLLLNDPSLRSWPMSVYCLFDTGGPDTGGPDTGGPDTGGPDTGGLDVAGRQLISRSHSVVRGWDANPDYLPDLAMSIYSTPLESPPPVATRFVVTRTRLTEMRSAVRSTAAGFGVTAVRVDDLVLAANEIVTNSLRYGGGRADVAMWFDSGAVVCDIRDRGHVSDPLAGRFAPPPSATSGRGLWLANHLCDLVQLRSSTGGTVVRLHVDR